jgi:hypothetical protein
VTWTVEPAETSATGETDAVTTAPASAVAGSPAMSATDAYRYAGILMVDPVLQGVSLDKSDVVDAASTPEPSGSPDAGEVANGHQSRLRSWRG